MKSSQMIFYDLKFYQEDSMFQMRLPYDLMSFLQQEKRADMFQQIKTQLLVQKEEIESDSCKSILIPFSHLVN